MSDETLRTGLSPEEMQIPNDIWEKLRKTNIGIPLVVFQRIQKDSDTYEEFILDISILESNPNEKGHFEQLYLRGFGQVVIIDGKEMTFANIAKMDEERRKLIQATLDKNDPDAGEDLRDFLKKAANQRVEVKKGVEQAANQRVELARKNVTRLDTELQSSTDQIRSISSLSKDLEQKALEEARKNPPKELKDVPIEEYSKFENFILANYADKNAEELSRTLNHSDRQRFEQSLTNARLIMGRPTRFEDATKSLVLGPGRDQIESRGRELIKGGYSENVIWNNDNRTITFQKPNGETRIIETTSLPPRERIEKSGLSISRDIPKIDKQDKERNLLSENQAIARREVATDYSKIERLDGSKFPRELKSEGDTHINLYKKFESGSTAAERLEALKEIRTSNLVIDIRRRGGMTPENMEQMEQLEGSIERERSSISKMIESLERYIAGEKKLEGYPRSRTGGDTFEDTARGNLSWLTSEGVWFDRMGPDADNALERIIREINRTRDAKNTIDLSGKNLDDENKSTLRKSYEAIIKNLKYPSNILRQSDIGDFQKRITESLGKNPNDSGSIESLMRSNSTPS